jgi:hypothetical protein
MAASPGFAPGPSGSKPDMLLITLRGNVVEPEVVATSPNRIKSPVPVCCGFGSKNLPRKKRKTQKINWRNAVDSHHLPEGTHSLAPRPGTLGRLTFQMACRAEARSSEGWCSRPGLHWHWADFKSAASALGYGSVGICDLGLPI